MLSRKKRERLLCVSEFCFLELYVSELRAKYVLPTLNDEYNYSVFPYMVAYGERIHGNLECSVQWFTTTVRVRCRFFPLTCQLLEKTEHGIFFFLLSTWFLSYP
jgi:hypothetical protein